MTDHLEAASGAVHEVSRALGLNHRQQTDPGHYRLSVGRLEEQAEAQHALQRAALQLLRSGFEVEPVRIHNGYAVLDVHAQGERNSDD